MIENSGLGAKEATVSRRNVTTRHCRRNTSLQAASRLVENGMVTKVGALRITTRERAMEELMIIAEISLHKEFYAFPVYTVL